MNYNETLNYIHSVSNFFCKPGLSRIQKLCDFLGNPQDTLKFIHVAGTNGKGSFCAMLSQILIDAGYKVGTYTSPYILEFNERISINGEMISNGDLTEICEYIKPFADQMEDKVTEFELITAIAFEYFRREKCDIVVLECGLGGKYDATNIITTPVLSVITGVDFDHQNFLGNTIEQIADEKSGIIKNGIRCLWCGDSHAAEKIIENTAKSKNSELVRSNHNEIKILKTHLDGTEFDFADLKNLFIPLLSLYQPYNAANAITAAKLLNKSGFTIREENIKNGLRKVRWKARFEVINSSPLVIFDGSHNPQGVCATIDSIKHYFDNKKVNILTGVMKDKDYRFIAKTISEVADNVYCITPDNPRALTAEEYCSVFQELGTTAFSFNNIKSALNSALSNNNIPLICMGSLYMYGEIYNIINENSGN